MSLRDRLESVSSEATLAEAMKLRTHPTGWEPGVVWDPDKGGQVTTGPLPGEPKEWAEILSDWGLDPEVVTVVPGSVQIRAWDANVGGGEIKRLRYYRATVIPRSSEAFLPDLEALYKEVRKAKPHKETVGGDHTLLICLSDFQTGNPDDEGLEGQLRALAALVDSIPARFKALKKAGYEIGTICVAGLGDLIEGTCGFYHAQRFRVEIDRREQVKIVRRAIRDILMAVAPLTDDVKVVCVPGNHGENRDAFKSYTRVGDNDDVAVFEQVAEILNANPDAYGHIKFRIPSDEIAVTVELSGQHVAFTHGHVAKMRGNAAETLWGWWKDQAMGRAYPGVADADILIAGHYHHLNVKEQRNRAVFVCPSLTNVSEYFSDSQGVNTRHGTLTLLIGPDGWKEMALI